MRIKEQMRLKIRSLMILGSIFFLLFHSMTLSVMAQMPPNTFSDLVEKLMPAVVNISIHATIKNNQQPFQRGRRLEDFLEDFMQQRRHSQEKKQVRKISSLGSGFVIDPEGTIVTNNHVINNADEIFVTFSDGQKYPAEIVGRDSRTDVAVLKVKVSKKLPFLTLGDDSKMRVGDWVFAIGNPFGLGGSLSVGVVSAVNRNINSGPYDSYIQTDAAINKGNSGGPLFNLEGEVIGVNTAIISPSGGSVGIGFAMPANLVKTVISQLQDYGETRRGWLGVRIQEVTSELAESLSMDRPYGALVSEVTPNGPAEKSGIKQGDVIISFDGKKVSKMHNLPRIVAETKIDKHVEVTVLRRGKKRKLNVQIGRLEERTSGNKEQSSSQQDNKDNYLKILGLTLKTLNNDMRESAKLKENEGGVYIVSVDQESIVDTNEIRAGYIILEINQTVMRQPKDVVNLIKKSQESGSKSVLVFLKTPIGKRFIALKIAQ